jgi:AcrR family transcriptional regulator
MSRPPTHPSGSRAAGFSSEDGKNGHADTQGERLRRQRATRERIFETALREFREFGFAASEIDRIAKAAGVARGTFYFHFASKDDVLLELARRINGRVVRRVAVFGESQPTFAELLMRVNDAIMEEHSRVGEAGLLAEMLSLYVRRPHDVNDPRQNLPTLAEELARHVRAAVDRGELEASTSPEQLSILVMASLFGIHTRIPAGEASRTASRSLIELLARAVRR